VNRLFCIFFCGILSTNVIAALPSFCLQNGGNYICNKASFYFTQSFGQSRYQTPEDACRAAVAASWSSSSNVNYVNGREDTSSTHPQCISDVWVNGQTNGDTHILQWIDFVQECTAPDFRLFTDSNEMIHGEGQGWCGRALQYVAGAPPINPTPQCSVGNPIDTSTGTKIQKETDIYSRGINQVNFDRTYNNGNKSDHSLWFNPYQKSLRVITPEKIIIGGKKSSPYTSKSQACTSGWSEIKSNITESWAQGTTAQYVNDTCQVKRNNIIVRNIPILPDLNHLYIYLKPGSIQLVRENGSIYSFGLSTNDQYRELNGERGQLTAISNSAPIAWRFKTNSGDIEDYNADGKLLSITASNGMKQELFYDATSDLLFRVKDSTNRELLFAYTDNQISSVTVDGNKTTSYTYNALGLITKVTRPDSTTRIYHYEDSRFPTALTGITDERSARYATWAYDAQGRAISSEHAGGAEKTMLAFNADGSTTVTNALNKQTIYRFADIAGARRVTKVEGQPTANCIGANQDYTYTPEGWIASKTDWKGIKTTFTYNALGQEISRTEAFATPEARTVTTEWHPTFFVKTKVTEPEKETIYSYDANGRLLNQSTQSISAQ